MNRSALTRWHWVLVVALVTALVGMVPQPVQAQSAVRPDIKFAGVIQAVPAAPDYPFGVWRVAGKEVVVDPTTRLQPGLVVATVGAWADVTAHQAADGTLIARHLIVMPAEIRLKGPIGAKPAQGNVGEWTIAGQRIMVNADTRISQRGATLEVGNWAEVFASKTVDGLLALRLRGIEYQQDVEIFGAIESFDDTQWVISGIPLTVVTGTLILGTPAVDLLAQASATLQEDGSLQALRLKVAMQTPEGPRRPVSFDGVVESLPERGLIGQWVVSGRQVTVSAATAINQAKGLAVVGSKAHVVGWQADGHVIALLIVVLESPTPGGRFVLFQGPIEKLPESGLIGEWQVAGRTVRVTENTRIASPRYAGIGAIAVVGGMEAADGVVTAIWIKIAPQFGPR